MDFEEIYEPVETYQKYLRAAFDRNSREAFEEIVAKSGCDEKLNAEKVRKINALKNEIARHQSKKNTQEALRVLAWLVAVAGFGMSFVCILACFQPGERHTGTHLLAAAAGLILGAAALYWIFTCLNKKIHELAGCIRSRQTLLDARLSEAWAQLAPLNRLYQWDTIANLITKTVPIFKLDKYFSNARLEELVSHFGMSGISNQENSMLYCQSGALNGNPFLICTTKNYHMGTQDYHGSLSISWQEEEDYTDSNGNRKTRWVTKFQTLHATVTKPKPAYGESRFLIYGNEAAPDLEFHRHPSSFANPEGFFSSMKQGLAISSLRRKSQQLNGFMALSNAEFDAVFGALDRNSEVQFRLLFTPLAQREMLKILRDSKVGYGDDFKFRKNRQINIVQPAHFRNLNISCDPGLFHHYDLAMARKVFRDYSAEYFRSFFFAFAPLLAIPLYQQHRSDLDIFREVYGSESSCWECETIANDFGEEVFKHAESVTDNILKVSRTGPQVAVTAYGFRGESRTDWVSVYGNDGHSHDVPVEWTEYLPVERTSSMVVTETGGLNQLEFEEKLPQSQKWQEFFRAYGTTLADVKYRRSLIAFLREN